MKTPRSRESFDKIGENSREWGEEKEDGVIYTVSLKKVRHQTTSTSLQKLTHGENWFQPLQWETMKLRTLKAGTVERLVENLAPEDVEDQDTNSMHLNVFLATYRAFTTADQVLDILFRRYKEYKECRRRGENGKDSRHDVCRIIQSVLCIWMDIYQDDFDDPPAYRLLHRVLEFAESHMSDGELARHTRHKLDRLRRNEALKGQQKISVPNGHHLTGSEDVLFIENSDSERPLELDTISVQTMADQLTYMDAELFKKVVPHHCLGSVWSRRDKKCKSTTDAPTVKATIAQFNAVSFLVIATILRNTSISTEDRVRIIEKWVDIAQECRILKNFSSLKAIISGLQSNPIYRLSETWAAVSKEKSDEYEELCTIFSEENNQMTWREILVKEGTAKYADTSKSQLKHVRKENMQKIQAQRLSGVMQGTVPYLGTFLTDLMMLDTAMPDTVDTNLINFEKKKKEFEVLAQIQLLQKTAQNYNIMPEPRFKAWFDSVEHLRYEESYRLSCEVQPLSESMSPPAQSSGKERSLRKRISRLFSTSDWETSSANSNTSQSEDRVSETSMPDSPDSLMPEKMSASSSSSSLTSLEMSTSPYKAYDSSSNCVIRVSLSGESDNIYKSVLLTHQDHTPGVIKSLMTKFNLEAAEAEEYKLVQKLPDGELQIPDHGNCFYAINQSVEPNFILRKKSEEGELHRKSKKRTTLRKLMEVVTTQS
ncbi:ral guanine nucleotide dissociation stimulator-like 1 isoform X4 [Branchiostoma lanceolatum]|uniref:ral guanine nucleotide dissociation stimulator-like 1 isoform X4 n=1 Tax=Branchiostoma lanceolatum TaxID=7740 RepID=UPI0034546BCF